MVQYGSDDEYVFLGREMGARKSISESTAREIDGGNQVLSLMEATKPRGTSFFNNRDKLDIAFAGALLEYETLDHAQVEEIVKTGKFTPPPPKPQSETILGAPAGTPLAGTPPKALAAETARLGNSPRRATV